MNDKKFNKIFYIILILIGVAIKFSLLNIKTGDYVGFLEPWLKFIETNGYEKALRHNFYDYSPAYIYFLVLIAKLGINPLYSVKILSIIFEYILAFFVGKTAQLKTKNNAVVWISMAVIPLLPSILLNSSYLSQCDSIYSTFIMVAIYFSLKEKSFLSVLCLGLSFAFKMQGVFILPFFFIMMLRGKIPFYYFFIIPTVYLISLLPTWYYGRPLSDSLLTYLAQTDRWGFLTMNFPNFYIFIDNSYYEIAKAIGVGITFVFTLLFGLWFAQKKYFFTFDDWIRLAFLSALIIPFLLPGMHERYLYLADVLGILYFLVFRKNIVLPIGVLAISFYSYTRMSRFNEILPMEPAFFIYLLIIIFVSIDFIKSFKASNHEYSQ